MKKTNYLLIILLSIFSCNTEVPTQFSGEALQDNFITLQNDDIILKDILELHKGKKILIDVWASWCGDCIKGMPAVKTLQEEFPDVVFLFLSEDRNTASWKRGIQKYKVKGEHYFMEKGAKGDFAKFLNSNWIPRYMVINKAGNIELFKAVKADDNKLIEALKK